MESSLYNRIFQRVSSEVSNDEEFCTYLAEICTDSNSHSDDLRDIIDKMFKTNYSNISETRRQHIIYSLLDMIEEDRQKINKEVDTEDADDLDLGEKLERDGECKLCGCNHHISSMKQSKDCFFVYLTFVVNFSSSSYSKINS
jgi:hypothetical protein